MRAARKGGKMRTGPASRLGARPPPASTASPRAAHPGAAAARGVWQSPHRYSPALTHEPRAAPSTSAAARPASLLLGNCWLFSTALSQQQAFLLYVLSPDFAGHLDALASPSLQHRSQLPRWTDSGQPVDDFLPLRFLGLSLCVAFHQPLPLLLPVFAVLCVASNAHARLQVRCPRRRSGPCAAGSGARR
jgi:hypothetical protein